MIGVTDSKVNEIMSVVSGMKERMDAIVEKTSELKDTCGRATSLKVPVAHSTSSGSVGAM